MNNVKLILFYISIFLFISCGNSPFKKQRPLQQIMIKSIIVDTTFGFPHPSNFFWEDFVRRGPTDIISHKNSKSFTPLWEMVNDSIHEIYRIDAFPYQFVLTFNGPNATVNALFVKCNEVLIVNCIKAFDSLPKVEKLIKLTTKETISLKKQIASSQFWKMPVNGSGGIGSEGYPWKIEGVKDSLYSAVWQWVPKEFNYRVYELGQWLFSLAERNGLKK